LKSEELLVLTKTFSLSFFYVNIRMHFFCAVAKRPPIEDYYSLLKTFMYCDMSIDFGHE